ncbi:DNA alkylation repair protein [candidate division KSB1 bacterium]|nr:DNA alkylation repair protein [candidate division KSB1 bacterium]
MLAKIDTIEREIFARRDQKKASVLRKKVNTHLQIAGLSRADRLNILRNINEYVAAEDDEFMWLNLLQELWESPWFESRLIILQLLFLQHHRVDTNIWDALDLWTDDIDTWVLADWLGHIRGIVNKKAPYLSMRMAAWLRSEKSLRRRSALVSLTYLSPENGELSLILKPQETLAFLEPIVSEKHGEVIPALAWLLNFIKTLSPEAFGIYYENIQHDLHPSVRDFLTIPAAHS